MSIVIPSLDKTEGMILVFTLLITQAFFAAGGIVGAIVVSGLFGGDWVLAALGGWVGAVADSLFALPWRETICWGVGIAAACCVAAIVSERRALRSEKARASVYAARQGMDGELPRLPIVVIVLLMAVTGFCEELLFRYAVIGIVCVVLSPVLSSFPASVAALFVSSLVFWLAHVRYRNLASTASVLALGFVFGVTYLVTASLGVVALAHALYDVAVMLVMRIKMVRDPDYFGGSAPDRVLADLDADSSPMAGKKSPPLGGPGPFGQPRT